MRGIRADSKGRVGFANHMGSIRQRIKIADFTDGLGTTGYVDLDAPLPDGCIVLGWMATVHEAVTVTATGTLLVGVSGDTDRFTGTTDPSVATAGQTVIGSVPMDNTGQAPIVTAETTVRVTIEEGADFTTCVTGATGIIDLCIYFIDAR